ncbi:hypothetical protein [Paractinoplanes maris]|uniref:hypothetical protein n=1 Tax=Paractinoplanes maris TaxID=1734446 RepID=UPI002021655C|nr:hypothetical protein [Actinoplanes maris]
MLPLICDACNQVYSSKLILPSSFRSDAISAANAGAPSKCPRCGHVNGAYRIAQATEHLRYLASTGLSREQLREVKAIAQSGLDDPEDLDGAAQRVAERMPNGFLPFRVWPTGTGDRIALISLLVTSITLLENIAGDWADLAALARPRSNTNSGPRESTGTETPSPPSAQPSGSITSTPSAADPVSNGSITVVRPTPNEIFYYRYSKPYRYRGEATFSPDLTLWFFSTFQDPDNGDKFRTGLPVAERSGKWKLTLVYERSETAYKTIHNCFACLRKVDDAAIRRRSETMTFKSDENQFYVLKGTSNIRLEPPLFRIKYDKLRFGQNLLSRLLVDPTRQVPTLLRDVEDI